MNINNIKIRNAKIKDIEKILEIEHNSFDKNICEDRKVFIDRIETFNKGFLVAEYENEIIGYICSEIWLYNENLEESSFLLNHSIKKSHKATGDELYISSFAISPKARKYGIGKILFNYLTDNVDKLVINPKSLLLVVAENWISARNIYIKKGFHEVCKLKDFFDYNNIEPFKADGIVMRKLL